MKIARLFVTMSILTSVIIVSLLLKPVIMGDYVITYEKENPVTNRMAVGSIETDCCFEFHRDTFEIITQEGSYVWSVQSSDHILITENSFINETYCYIIDDGTPIEYGLTGDWVVKISGSTVTITDSIGAECSWRYEEFVIYPSINGNYTQFTTYESAKKIAISDINQIFSTYLQDDILVSVNGDMIYENGNISSGEVTYTFTPFRDSNGMYILTSETATSVITPHIEDSSIRNFFIPTNPTITRFVYSNGAIDIAILAIVTIALIRANCVVIKKPTKRTEHDF